MQKKCMDAVAAAAQAAGRKAPTKAQLQDIEDRIVSAKVGIARADPQRWQGLSEAQRLQEATDKAMQDIAAEAANKRRQAELQVMAAVRVGNDVAALQTALQAVPGHAGTRAEAVSQYANITERMVTVLRKESFGNMIKLIEAAADKAGAGMGRKALMTLFDAENPMMTRDIVREVFKPGSTKNGAAAIAAKAWLDTIEGMRQRFNNAGGDVGRLEYGYVPQPHDTARVRKAGPDQWARDTLPLLDRSRYLRPDGSRMDDAEVSSFLRSAYDSLATEGVNKQVPGQFKGQGKRANRGQDSRQIHFADGEAWIGYMQKYGRGSLYDAMMAHVGGMARDITLVERFGPGVTQTQKLMLDEARVSDGKAMGDDLVPWHTVDPETYFKIINGEVGAPKNEALARTGMMVRNLMVASKLGGAVISSVTDIGTLAITAGYHRLPYWQLLKDIGAQTSSEAREFMSTHGMIAESVSDAMNRWSGDNLGTNWSGKLANSVMKWSLLNAWTDGLRQGFTLTMNAKLADMAKRPWDQLDARDRSRFERSGITADDWAAMNKVQAVRFRGRELLTPDAIRASGDDALAQKVFGFIVDESEYAVVNPDMTTRAVITFGGQQAGTIPGELARTVMQFKSFPVAMMTRHWRRMMEADFVPGVDSVAANRMAYGSALLLTSLALGMVAFQSKQVLQGKDPVDVDENPRVWLRALAQGGGLAIAGDLFLMDPAESRGDGAATLAKNLVGPALGSASELALKVISENVWQAAQGKDTDWEAELFSWAKSNTPGQNLWWLKPAVDHSFMNAVHENLSPGYLNRAKKRAQKSWGQDYWWAPEDAFPERAPDLSAAVPGG
jgi:hypothetical protein